MPRNLSGRRKGGGKPPKREARHQKVASSSYCIQTAMGKPSGLSTNEEESQETGLFLHQRLVRERVGLVTLRPQTTPLPIPPLTPTPPNETKL